MRTLIGILFICGMLAVSCSDSGSSQHEHMHAQKMYTCPMHPQIIRDKPGKCPICGMDLVEKKNEGESIEDTSINLLLKPTNEVAMGNFKTVKLVEKEMAVDIEATGNIIYDTRMINTISSRVSGRIEKLYVKYRYQPIRPGEKLMDIYSKELVTEQENFIYLLSNDADNKEMVSSAETRLGLLGLTKEQIGELKKTKKVFSKVSIYSTYSGHLHDLSPMQSGGMDGMKESDKTMAIQEGMYVEKGQTLFNVYSTDKVWALLNIYADKQDVVKKGQEVELRVYGTERTVNGKIDLLEPTIRAGLKAITARVNLDNKEGDLKIGANVRATIKGVSVKSKFLPKTAVLSLGMKNVVFVKRAQAFEAVEVVTGDQSGEWIGIRSGLTGNEEVAASAHFLMDSEGFVKYKK